MAVCILFMKSMFALAVLEDLLFLHLFHRGTCEIFHPPVNIHSRAPAGMTDDVSRGVAPHLDNSFRASSGAVIDTKVINKQVIISYCDLCAKWRKIFSQGFTGLSEKTTTQSRARLLNKPRLFVPSDLLSPQLSVGERKEEPPFHFADCPPSHHQRALPGRLYRR